MRLVIVCALAAVSLAACSVSTGSPSSGEPTTAPSAARNLVTATVLPSPTGTAEPSPTTTPLPRAASCGSPATEAASAAPSDAGVTLYHDPSGYVDAQVELISPAGQRVLIDVASPDDLSTPARRGDVLLTTHDHPDHVNAEFQAAFPGRTVARGGSLSVNDVRITGIKAAHGSDAGPMARPDRSDFIYLVEMGGLRIAHFGDFGQPALTQVQLDALGRIDVAITQLSNPYSSVDATNRLAFDMIEQICPRIVIPTHMLVDSSADMAMARSVWKAMYSPQNHITLMPATLPPETTLLVIGTRGASLGPFLNLALSPY